MEDLHVHEVQQGMKVSKESSSATLGAMLPQVPPDKTIIKKKEGIDDMIPEELMEFIYNEDATYTYAVEGAISNMAHNVKDKFSDSAHAKDVKAATLPFKVRQLTIERATLRAKISWMSKRKSKQEKVLKYKKRLVEVEQALRRIQNTVNSADEKKQIEAQIKELDSQVTRSVSSDLEQRGVLEAVNAFLREGDLEITEFTKEELFGDEGVLTEGANADLLQSLMTAKIRTSKMTRKIKKAIKKKDFNLAAKYIGDLNREVERMENAIKSYPVDDLKVNIVGTLIGAVMLIIEGILSAFGVALVGDSVAAGVIKGAFCVVASQPDADIAAASVAAQNTFLVSAQTIASVADVLGGLKVIVKAVKEIKANLEEFNPDERGKSLLNGVLNKTIVQTNRMRDKLEKLQSNFAKAKRKEELKQIAKEARAKMKAESVEDAVIESAFNEGYDTELDTNEMGIMLEARDPDEGMQPILSKLHDKGYKTKYSCAGHKDSGSKDRNDDGIVNGKLTSAARIMFNGDYDFPDPPKHWGFKTVDGKDYLYVLQFSNDGKDPKAFDDWKSKYMASLERWVDSLPTAKEGKEDVIDTPKDDAKDKEKDVKESVDFDSLINNEMAMLMMDLSDNF
jgi:hypothetical protein